MGENSGKVRVNGIQWLRLIGQAPPENKKLRNMKQGIKNTKQKDEKIWNTKYEEEKNG